MSARAAGAAGGVRNKENAAENGGTPGKQPSLKQQLVAQSKASSAQKVRGRAGEGAVARRGRDGLPRSATSRRCVRP
jgi:hypothetical protein